MDCHIVCLESCQGAAALAQHSLALHKLGEFSSQGYHHGHRGAKSQMIHPAYGEPAAQQKLGAGFSSVTAW